VSPLPVGRTSRCRFEPAPLWPLVPLRPAWNFAAQSRLRSCCIIRSSGCSLGFSLSALKTSGRRDRIPANKGKTVIGNSLIASKLLRSDCPADLLQQGPTRAFRRFAEGERSSHRSRVRSIRLAGPRSRHSIVPDAPSTAGHESPPLVPLGLVTFLCSNFLGKSMERLSCRRGARLPLPRS